MLEFGCLRCFIKSPSAVFFHLESLVSFHQTKCASAKLALFVSKCVNEALTEFTELVYVLIPITGKSSDTTMLLS